MISPGDHVTWSAAMPKRPDDGGTEGDVSAHGLAPAAVHHLLGMTKILGGVSREMSALPRSVIGPSP